MLQIHSKYDITSEIDIGELHVVDVMNHKLMRYDMNRINQLAVDLIKSYEGIEDGDPSTVNLDPYLCPGNVWTIGWGHAISSDNKLLRGKSNEALAYSIFPDGITMREAEDLIMDDISIRTKYVIKHVKVPLSENQLGAIVSFVYNVGIGNFIRSTLLKKLNNGDYQDAADEFRRWRYSNGKVLKGLERRRVAEKALFLKESDPIICRADMTTELQILDITHDRIITISADDLAYNAVVVMINKASTSQLNVASHWLADNSIVKFKR